jgi:phosphate transport system permease protein
MTATTISGRRQAPVRDLRRRRRPGETAIELLLALCGVLSVGTTIAIVAMLVKDGGDFFREIGIFDFLFGTVWQPKGSPAKYGVLALASGTLLVAAIALLVAVPLGLAAATYLSEYARDHDHPDHRERLRGRDARRTAVAA